MLPDSQTCAALARAVVDAGRWRWQRGMMSTCGPVVSSVCGAACRANGDRLVPLPPDALPDFTDPLTAAGALPVAREVRKLPGLYCAPNPHPNPAHAWIAWGGPVGGHDFRMCGSGPTELEALIAAILAAPEIK